MRNRLAVVSIAAAIAALALPAGASAATEIGNVCKAESGFPQNSTEIQLENATSALPVAVPVDGVLTGWKVKSGVAETETQQLVVFRPTGGADEYRVVATSSPERVATGTNVFPARLPVRAGDHLGLFGPAPSGALFCEGGIPGDRLGVTFKELDPSEVPTQFGNQAPYRVPVSAVVEPDGDGDGYGDETQDKCPLSAQFQAECPKISLDQLALSGRAAVTDLVTVDHEAPVTVSATAKVPLGGSRHSAHGSATISLQGGTQTVVPGRLAKFELKLPKRLRQALSGLPKGKASTLTIKASATNLVGQVSTETTTLKLKR